MRRAGVSAAGRSWCTTTGRAAPPRVPGGCCATTATTTCACSTAAGRPGVAAGGEVETDGRPATAARGRLRPARPGRMPVVDAPTRSCDVDVLVDARAPERYRGETEPIDPVAGHIPGRGQRPDRRQPRRPRALPPAARAARRSTPPSAPCRAPTWRRTAAAGVTACHDVLALEVAGVRAALYPGSWSEWVADPDRPIAP